MNARIPAAHVLMRHRDIRNWVDRHKGTPAIQRVPNLHGRMEPRLTLKFGSARAAPAGLPSEDDGMSPVSWTAWLAELDRRRLALRVTDRRLPAFELVQLSEPN